MNIASKPSSANSSSTVNVRPITWFVLIATPSLEVRDFAFDDRLGQAELGNAVHQHAARFVERFEDRDAVTHLCEIGRDCQSGGAVRDGTVRQLLRAA
jgi:hypothetical protein